MFLFATAGAGASVRFAAGVGAVRRPRGAPHAPAAGCRRLCHDGAVFPLQAASQRPTAHTAAQGALRNVRTTWPASFPKLTVQVLQNAVGVKQV